MAALEAGVRAPEIELSLLDGSKFSLSEARKLGPVVAAFFKVNCPTCQLAFPYLDRIFKAYSQSGKVTLVGISQNEADFTEAFRRKFGVTLPMALDVEENGYPASNAYGLTNVPSVFLISPGGEIELSSVGWAKTEMEELSRKLAVWSSTAPAEIFRAGENVPEFKPG